MDRFTRCFYLFDGKSDAQLQQARDRWKVWQELDDATFGYFAQNLEGDGIIKPNLDLFHKTKPRQHDA